MRLNNTYFTGTSDIVTSPCQLSVCRAGQNICQIRLDFEEFEIAGPLSTGELVNAATSSDTTTSNTNCEAAIFTASSHGKNSAMNICGNNRGHHMIQEAEDSCNILGEISRISRSLNWMTS